jgi:hypothetical protein
MHKEAETLQIGKPNKLVFVLIRNEKQNVLTLFEM